MLRPTAALLSAHIAVSAAIERGAVEATDHDATTLDLLLRLALSPDKRLRGVELGRQLRLNPGYISRRIDRAERAGLVTRVDDPTDRRAQQIVLTDSGQAAIDGFVPHLNQVLSAVIFDTLTSEEVELFISLLSRVESAAKTRIDHETPT